MKKMRLIKAAVVNCVTHPAGTVIEVGDEFATRLVNLGKAEPYTEPKPKKAAKKAPENRMINDDEIEDR